MSYAQIQHLSPAQMEELFSRDSEPAFLDDIPLVESDGDNMDSHWHGLAMACLIESINCLFRGRDDYYVGGNMFIYHTDPQSRKLKFKGPDFFYVKGVPKRIRRYWVPKHEGGRFPNVLIELLSPSTETDDLTTKKDLYEQVYHTPEYFCFDPEDQELLGWRLKKGRYESIEPDERGWIWSEQFRLWLGVWKRGLHGFNNIWLRFFDTDGAVVKTFGEAAEDRADAEQRRADAAEAELAQLKKQLEGPRKKSKKK